MNKLLCLLGIFICISCNPREIVIDAPVDLIPQDSFIQIVTDLIVLESHIQGKYDQLNSYSEVMAISGDSLFAEHGVSFERFESSMMYYGKNPHIIDSIYTRIIDTLNIRLGNN